jgi:hypothetical protein
MDLTAPWTIMLDHRLPEFRAVDLLACAASLFWVWLGNQDSQLDRCTGSTS